MNVANVLIAKSFRDKALLQRGWIILTTTGWKLKLLLYLPPLICYTLFYQSREEVLQSVKQFFVFVWIKNTKILTILIFFNFVNICQKTAVIILLQQVLAIYQNFFSISKEIRKATGCTNAFGCSLFTDSLYTYTKSLDQRPWLMAKHNAAILFYLITTSDNIPLHFPLSNPDIGQQFSIPSQKSHNKPNSIFGTHQYW